MTGQNDKCVATFEKGLLLYPCDFNLLYALFAYYMNQNDRVKARTYVERLRACFPEEKSVQDLYDDFMESK
jgi:hypothetical protein